MKIGIFVVASEHDLGRLPVEWLGAEPSGVRLKIAASSLLGLWMPGHRRNLVDDAWIADFLRFRRASHYDASLDDEASAADLLTWLVTSEDAALSQGSQDRIVAELRRDLQADFCAGDWHIGGLMRGALDYVDRAGQHAR
ncbi:hypothetical protein BH20CHL6_BH20CHL6_14280 [soil metagenome]